MATPTNPFYTQGAETTIGLGQYLSQENYIVDSNNIIQIWAQQLMYESEAQQQLAFLEGDSDSPCWKKDEFVFQKGLKANFSLMKRMTGDPFQGDRVTYGLEQRIVDANEQVTIKEWRMPAITGRASNQAAFWNYDAETQKAMTRYVSERKDTHKLKILMGVSVNDGEDSPAAIFTGESPTRIVYPEGTAALSEITSSHVFDIKQAARAVEKLQAGYTGSGTATNSWVAKPPKIGGYQVDAICLLHPYCKFDLRWEDERRLEGWMRDAEAPGKDNRIWAGIPDKFIVDGVLYVVPRYPLDRLMIYATAPWSSGLDTSTPGTNVALNIVMGASALCRAICIEDILEFEDYDGKQFKRIIGGSFEGLTKTRFNRSDSSNAQDYAAVIVPCAANAH